MCKDIIKENKNTFTNKRKIKDILPLTFRLMKFCGLWQPYKLSSFFKILYTLYKLLIMFILITVTLSLVCVTFFSVDGLKNSLFENLFLLLTLLNGCIKILVILIKKQKILSLITALAQYQPENIKEEKIQAEFDEEIKYT